MQLALGIVFGLALFAVGAVSLSPAAAPSAASIFCFSWPLRPWRFGVEESTHMRRRQNGIFNFPRVAPVRWQHSPSWGSLRGLFGRLRARRVQSQGWTRTHWSSGFRSPDSRHHSALLRPPHWAIERYVAPFVIGFGLQIFVALAEYCAFSRPLFIAGVLIANMTTTFTTPYVQAVLASLDGPAGRVRSAALQPTSGPRWPCAWCCPHRPNGGAHRRYIVHHVFRRPGTRALVAA